MKESSLGRVFETEGKTNAKALSGILERRKGLVWCWTILK